MTIKQTIREIYRFNQYRRDRVVADWATARPAGCGVLDVGAGMGRYRDLFAHCDYKTQDFAAETGSLGRYTALDYVCDLTEIPVADATFDALLCTEVLEHVPDPDQAIREFARIIKPGGSLLLTAPLGARLHQEPYHFYGGYTPHWYRKFLPKYGFAIDILEANRGFFSLFGQESVYFSALIDPRRTRKTGWRWPLLVALWLVTLPFLRLLFPLVAAGLDRLGLAQDATVGYFVVATRDLGEGPSVGA